MPELHTTTAVRDHLRAEGFTTGSTWMSVARADHARVVRVLDATGQWVIVENVDTRQRSRVHRNNLEGLFIRVPVGAA